MISNLEQVKNLLEPKKLTPDELEKKVRDLEFKVNKIMEAFKSASYEVPMPYKISDTTTDDDKDPFYNDALQFSKEYKGKLAASTLQRKFSIGYARAARILDDLKK